MIKLLIKKFIPNHKEVQDVHVREKYGILSGVLGIVCNLFLFLLKLLIGLTMNSIAITSDAFNNLSDMGSSMMTVIGAKMSNQKPDAEHPFGHGRFEYVASLIISFIIMVMGFELLKNAVDKIIHPEPVQFSGLLMVILTVSVLIKVWMYAYNRYIGQLIDSKVNMATAYDSINDVVATGAVIITTLVGQFLTFPIDGIAGVLVSLLIMYTGFEVAKDTIDVLLGRSPSDDLVNKISSAICSAEIINGCHDLKVHDYGPGRSIASVHVEVSDQLDLVTAHSEIDRIEKKILRELGVDIVLHIDPMPAGATEPID